MGTLRNVFLVVGGILVVAGSVAVVALEFGSAAERRLVSRLRDTIEVLLPPLMVLVLVWLVALERT